MVSIMKVDICRIFLINNTTNYAAFNPEDCE